MTKYKTHAAQLAAVHVAKLSIDIYGSSDKETQDLQDGEFSLTSGYSEFDETDNTIAVKIGVRIDRSESNNFDLEIELIGVFQIDLTDFKREFVERWASTNAPLVLYPFIREHVYGLTSRAGVSGGLLLPLFEVPTFKIEK